MASLQLSNWQCKPQLKPVVCLCFLHCHLPYLSRECFLYLMASVTLLLPLREGADSVPATSRILCQVAPSLCTPRPRDCTASCLPPHEDAVPHRLSPGTVQPLSEPFSDVVRTCIDSLPISLWETGLLLCLEPTLPVCGPGAGPGD